MAKNNETSPLTVPGDRAAVITCYDAAAPDKSSARSSVASAVSERRLSTAHLFGIMIPKDFWYVSFCAVMSLSSSSMATIVNHKLFNKEKFPVELALIFQCLGTLLVSIAIGEVCHFCVKPSQDGKPKWPRFSFNPRLAIKLFLLGVSFTARVGLTNYALQNTHVSTYQVCRQTAVFWSVVISWLLLKYRPSVMVVVSILVIVAAFLVCGMERATLSYSGIFYGILCAIASAIYLCLSKYYLPLANNDHRILVNYNSVNAIPLAVLLSVVQHQWTKARMYFPALAENGYVHPTSQYVILFLIVQSVLASFCVNVASALFVKASSPVTYDVVGTLKAAPQVLYGIVWNNDPTTIYNIGGITLSVLGSLLYGRAKQAEHVKKITQDAIERKRLSLERRNQAKAGNRAIV